MKPPLDGNEPGPMPGSVFDPEKSIKRVLSRSRSPDISSPMLTKSTTAVDVEIYGSVYHVRGEQNREYLLELAEIVDKKMREIGEHVPVADTGKIAILAALNLADELLQSHQQQEGERAEIMEKVAELTAELTEAIDT